MDWCAAAEILNLSVLAVPIKFCGKQDELLFLFIYIYVQSIVLRNVSMLHVPLDAWLGPRSVALHSYCPIFAGALADRVSGCILRYDGGDLVNIYSR